MARLPISRGYDNIVDGQIPDEWSSDWFSRFLSTWMARGDVRNAETGPGITIVGQSNDVPTISLDTAKVPVSAVALPIAVTGSRGGNAALASLLTALASAGIITNSTTP